MKTVGDMRKYLEQSHRSPEAVALEFHVSNMTIRRLLRKSDAALLPEKYRVLFSSRSSEPAQSIPAQKWMPEIPASSDSEGFKKVLMDLQENGGTVTNPEKLQKDFESKIKNGNFAKEMISSLRKVAEYAFTGSRVSLRLMSIGAILYFVNVFDLIPDTLAPIGYVDDFAIVALVASQIHKERKRLKSNSTKA